MEETLHFSCSLLNVGEYIGMDPRLNDEDAILFALMLIDLATEFGRLPLEAFFLCVVLRLAQSMVRPQVAELTEETTTDLKQHEKGQIIVAQLVPKAKDLEIVYALALPAQPRETVAMVIDTMLSLGKFLISTAITELSGPFCVGGNLSLKKKGSKSMMKWVYPWRRVLADSKEAQEEKPKLISYAKDMQ
ncbi:hypothetical protein VNO77_22727 [Canavalia gladiata]|uniref:Uncharacterized protein n=1 Tax=Canavalia gladiata TaxID=3824 RepID=A0AAN9L6K2_CANGL